MWLNKILIFFIIINAFQYAWSQQQVLLPSQSTANSPAILLINLSAIQSSSWNSPVGDESSIAIKLYTRFNYIKLIRPFQVRATLNLALGVNYMDDSIRSNSIRLNENEAFGEFVLSVPSGWIIDPYFSIGFRTPITESFSFIGSKRIRTSKLWDPVTSQESTGFTLGHIFLPRNLSIRLGLSFQQIRAHNHTQMTNNFRTSEIEGYISQSGIEFINDINTKFDSTIFYTSRLGLFSSFDKLSIWTVRSDNEIRFQIWKFLGVTWSINILHDIKQSLKTQFRQSLTLGIIQSW